MRTRSRAKIGFKPSNLHSIRQIILRKNGKRMVKDKPKASINKTQILQMNDFSHNFYKNTIKRMQNERRRIEGDTQKIRKLGDYYIGFNMLFS